MNLLAFATLVIAAQSGANLPPLTIAHGDVISVMVAIPPASQPSQGNGDRTGSAVPTVSAASPFDGSYQVMSDGAIYGPSFGRIVVEGKTWEQARHLIRLAMKRFVKPDLVWVTISQQGMKNVYLLNQISQGSAGANGVLPWKPNLRLRDVLAAFSYQGETDLVEVFAFRGGRQIAKDTLRNIAVSGNAVGDLIIEPSDFVTVAPAPIMRVWVMGGVVHPGEMRLRSGATVADAIAEAGGLTNGAPDLETDVILRRGPQETNINARDKSLGTTPVQTGDAVTVVMPKEVRVTVQGQVVKPGQYTATSNTTVFGAIALAGGVSLDGTLKNVTLYREGQPMRLDLTQPSVGKDSEAYDLQPGDLIDVARNDRFVLVLGDVTESLRIYLQDNEELDAVTALARAGGIRSTGSLHHVFLVRRQLDGRAKAVEFALDDYIKTGKKSADPELRSGDVLLFGKPKGITIEQLNSVVSSAFWIDSISKL